MFDVLVRNARLPDAEGTTNVGIVDGRIDSIGDAVTDGEAVIDADGGLLAGGFVDPHVHLDKAYIAPDLPPNESGTLREAIENIHDRKASYTVEDVRERALQAIDAHVRNGCTRIRTHVDVDTIGGLTPLEGVMAARTERTEVADVQIVAFPQEGIVRHQGTEELLASALESGADVVGGMPHTERTDEHRREHVDVCLDLARRYDVPVDMHVDETDDPSARSLEYVAAKVIETGFDRPVTVGHACALAAYDDPHAAAVIDQCAEAGLQFVTNPPTNLVLQGRHDSHPKRRGITRVDELQANDVPVAAGQDCLLDGFYPYGRASMLETALLTAHAAQLVTPEERELAWEMVADTAAEILGVGHGIKPGARAVCNVFPPAVRTRHDALRLGCRPRAVIHDGAVVGRTTVQSELVLSAS